MIVDNSLRSGSLARVALTTGSTGGVGSHVVAELVDAGFSVLAQRRRAGEGDAATPAGVEEIHADLSTEASVTDLVEELSSRFDSIQCLVHLATPPIVATPALLSDDDAFRDHLTVQVLAFSRLARAVLPFMQRQQNGVIVGVLSTVIEPARPKLWWPYTTAKFAMYGLLSGLATDVEGSGVRVLGVMPSGVAGALSERAAVAQAGLLDATSVASLIRRAISEPAHFPNGCIARIEPQGVTVGRMTFTGTPLPS